MKDALYNFWLARSFTIMVVGFAVSAGGIIFFSQVQRKDPGLSSVAFAVTATGIAIYLLGRIGVVLQRRKERKKRIQATSSLENEQKEQG